MAKFMTTVDKKLRAQLSKIDNSQSILVEFLNNENSLAIGFTAWLDESDAARVDEIIDLEEEVTVFWPTCDTQSANLLKPQLRKVNFVKHVVKILAYGEWTEMKAQMENKIKYDKLNVSRKSRKNLKKRTFDEESSNFVAKKKTKKQKSVLAEKKQNEELLEKCEKQQVRSKFSLTSESENNAQGTKKQTLKENNSQKKLVTNSFSKLYDSDDSETDKQVPQDSMTNAKVPKGPKTILPYSDCDSEESPRTHNYNGLKFGKSKRILKNITNADDGTSIESNSLRKYNTSIEKSVSTDDISDTLLNNDIQDSKKTKAKRIKNEEVKYTTLQLAMEIQEGMPELPLSKQILSTIPKTDLKKYVGALASNIFTTEEFRNHSVTGKAPNSDPHMAVKPELPPIRKQYLYDLV